MFARLARFFDRYDSRTAHLAWNVCASLDTWWSRKCDRAPLGPSRELWGDDGDVVVWYDRALTGEEQEQVRKYIVSKWHDRSGA
jgi:hypothetical protein